MACGGQDRQDGPFGPGKPSDDSYKPKNCEKIEDDDECLEKCLLRKISDPKRPTYWLFGGGGRNAGAFNCRQWADRKVQECKSECKGKK